MPREKVQEMAQEMPREMAQGGGLREWGLGGGLREWGLGRGACGMAWGMIQFCHLTRG